MLVAVQPLNETLIAQRSHNQNTRQLMILLFLTSTLLLLSFPSCFDKRRQMIQRDRAVIEWMLQINESSAR